MLGGKFRSKKKGQTSSKIFGFMMNVWRGLPSRYSAIYGNNIDLIHSRFPCEYNPATIRTSTNVRDTKIAANKFMISPN